MRFFAFDIDKCDVFPQLPLVLSSDQLSIAKSFMFFKAKACSRLSYRDARFESDIAWKLRDLFPDFS
jgi:hypothetical protein